MRLNKGYKYVVLCEDAQMKSFILTFLSVHGISSRRIYFRSYPCGEGCGEAFVRREYVREARLLQASNYMRTTLIVCTDADRLTIKKREELLENAVKADIGNWNRHIEPVVLWIPKKEIETWIHFLDGDNVDEEMSFNHTGKPVSCKEQANLFALYCQGLHEFESEVLASMKFAKTEYERVCELQR